MADDQSPPPEQDGPPQAWSALVDLDKPRRPDPVDPLAADPEPAVSDTSEPVPASASASKDVEYEPSPAVDYDYGHSEYGNSEYGDPLPPAKPVTLPGTVAHLRRWVFLAALVGVWIPAAAVGIGVYRWWSDSADPTVPLFVLACYVVATVVAALLLAMAEHTPWVSAAAIAVLTAPFASTAAAAALYGARAFGWV